MSFRWLLWVGAFLSLASWADEGLESHGTGPGAAVGSSAKRLRCSALLDFLAANDNKIPTSIDLWRRLLEGRGGATRSVFPVSRAPASVDFDFPRFLLGAGREYGSLEEPWKKPATFGKLFVGLVPDDEDRRRQHAEVISYNDETGEYDFVVIKDFNNPSKREVISEGPEIDRCFSCHVNRGPIFLPREWIGSSGSQAAPRVGRVFFEHLLKTHPEIYKEAAARWKAMKKQGDNPERPPVPLLMDYTIRLPDGSDTGFTFADSAAGMDTTVHHSALRRKVMHVLKGKKPEEREAFFRAAVQLSIFGNRSDAYSDLVHETQRREANPDDPALYGDTIGSRVPDLMREDPMEFLKRKKDGSLKLDKDFSVVSPGVVHSGNSRDRGVKFMQGQGGASHLMQFDSSDTVVLDALKTDLKSAGLEAGLNGVVEAALASAAVSAILRNGIPQREKLLSALVSALKAQAKLAGAKQTPALDRIEYQARECQHRWDGKRADNGPPKEREHYGNCAWCHNKESGQKSRLFFGFDPASPEAWKEALSKGDDQRRAKVRAWLADAIEMLGELGMPPPRSPEGERITREERAKLLKALQALK